MKKINVWMLGDSTAAKKEKEFRPETGWAEKLEFLLSDEVKIKNLAKNGQSTKSFLNSERFELFRDEVATGDYVLIQFGHNDQKVNEKDKFTAPWGDYQINLLNLVDVAKQKKAHPILLTSVPRRMYDNAQQILDTFGDYLSVVRQISAVHKVPLIDMHTDIVANLNKLTKEQTERLYLNLNSGESINYPKGNKDNTHFSEKGADFVAKIFVDSLKNSDIGLKKYLRNF